MMRWLRRLFWLALLAAAGYAAYRALRRRQSSPATASQWSSLPATSNSATGAARPADNKASATARWVAPNDGACPDGYPVKVNESSGIFHVPGGRFYARTTADRCYASADDAIADGFRPAKV